MRFKNESKSKLWDNVKFQLGKQLAQLMLVRERSLVRPWKEDFLLWSPSYRICFRQGMGLSVAEQMLIILQWPDRCSRPPRSTWGSSEVSVHLTSFYSLLHALSWARGKQSLRDQRGALGLGRVLHSVSACLSQWLLCQMAVGGVSFWGMHSGYHIPQIPPSYDGSFNFFMKLEKDGCSNFSWKKEKSFTMSASCIDAFCWPALCTSFSHHLCK